MAENLQLSRTIQFTKLSATPMLIIALWSLMLTAQSSSPDKKCGGGDPGCDVATSTSCNPGHDPNDNGFNLYNWRLRKVDAESKKTISQPYGVNKSVWQQALGMSSGGTTKKPQKAWTRSHIRRCLQSARPRTWNRTHQVSAPTRLVEILQARCTILVN
ncbi:MAG: hypothetical protein LBP35_05510 [Candidatus Ancillula trichonymphae]|nr:hypothetical protein [Candidatus Ancillula trichonymphae]